MKKFLIISLQLILCLSLGFGQVKVVNILDFGAEPDGHTVNTNAIQRAIDEAHRTGGGKVIIPTGRFVTGSIVLKSHVNLYLNQGAVLLGSTDPSDYFEMDFPGRPTAIKQDDNSQMALILAHKARHITVAGEGTIDGQGLPLALAIDSLHHAGIAIDPRYNYRRNRPSETMRPKLFRFSQCTDVQISGLKVGSSACWGLSFELSHNLRLSDLTIVNRSFWNNDGIDITDCTNVQVTNCNVNAADDGICLKSYYEGYANDSIYIANCTIRSSASAIKFGSASFGGFRNIIIEGIRVFDTFRSAIAIESVDGAQIENVSVTDVIAKNTGNALFIRLGHRSGDHPGVVRNIIFRDMRIQIAFERPDSEYDLRGPEVDFFHNPFPASIVGLENQSIEDVSFENIELIYPGRASKAMAYVPITRLSQVPENTSKYPEFSMFGELPSWGFFIRHAKGITFSDVRLKVLDEDFRPAVLCDDVQGISMNQVEIQPAKPSDRQIVLNESTVIKRQAIHIQGVSGDGIFHVEQSEQFQAK